MGTDASPRLIGVTNAPFIRSHPQRSLDVAQLADGLGYHSMWVAEVAGTEAFTVLGAVGQSTTQIRLGCGVIPIQVRTPPLVAMAAATLQALHPSREVLLGIGVSSPVVAGRWHGCAYPNRPLAQIREFVELLRQCLSGERVDFDGDFYSIRGFRLAVPTCERRPKIIIGALGTRMMTLAGEVADGVLLNYVPARQVPWCVEQVRRGGSATIYANVHVGVGDPDAGEDQARVDLYSYAVVDAYAESFRRAGFGDAVDAIRTAHAAGDRAGALAAVSPAMIKEINPIGDPGLVREVIRAYRDRGVEMPVVFPLTWGSSSADALALTLAAAAEA